MTQPRGTWPFALFMLWVVLLATDVGLLLLMLLDPLYGLGALVVTLGVLLALMMGWLPLPRDQRTTTKSPNKRGGSV